MGGGETLTTEEIAKVLAYKDAGWSNRKIARILKRSPTAVNNVVNQKENYNTNRKNGNNQKVSPRGKAAIIRAGLKNNATASKIVAEFDLPITPRRVQQILATSNRLKWKKMKSKPALTNRHKVARLDFAKQHMSWSENWNKVVFSDEKKFNLDGPDGFNYYWHDIRQPERYSTTRNFGGGSLMIWAAFNYHNRTPICKVSGRLNSQGYINLLENVLLDFLDEEPTCDSIFQQDNAAIHVSQASRTWFQEKQIPIMSWPARSPDLNPIENMWGNLARQVYAGGRKFQSVEELRKTVSQEWAKIPQAEFQNMINSMPNRIFEVIQKSGGWTHY